MATCAASSSRIVVSSCRLGKTRTLPSAQLSNSATRCNSFDSIVNARSNGPSSSAPFLFSIPSPKPFSTISSAIHDQEKDRIRLALSSAVVAFTLGFVAATTSTSNSETLAAGPGSKSRPNGSSNRGGGGPFKTFPFGPVVEKNAEDDIRQLEEEARKDPYEVSIEALQGARWTMEDAYAIENGGRFAAVFDGHGGSDVSCILRERLYNLYRKLLVAKHWEARDESTPSKRSVPSISSHVGAIRGALEELELDVLKHEDLVYQGSTAVAVIMHVNEDGGKTLLSANVGDSRAVLSRKGKAVELTRDHKPNDEREKARIRALGEDIQWDPYGQLYRVRDLSLSRAIGDRFAKPAVSSEAEIQHFPLSDEEDEFIILASDGLWDVMSSQEAVDYVHQSVHDPDSASKEWNKKVPKTSIARKVAHEALERGSADNVCVLIVWLRDESSK